MKDIYILLTKTGTIPARMIHVFKGGTFTHTSLSMTPSTDCLYSYARRKINNPLIAGLITENIHTEVFAMYPNCHCALYKLRVSDVAYDRMVREITHYMNNYKRAKYNFLGLVPLALGIRIKRKFRLTCSQFVAVILDKSREIELPKDPYIMLPNDFKDISGIELVYDGMLKDCKISVPTYVTV